jgi:hypothetical protein
MAPGPPPGRYPSQAFVLRTAFGLWGSPRASTGAAPASARGFRLPSSACSGLGPEVRHGPQFSGRPGCAARLRSAGLRPAGAARVASGRASWRPVALLLALVAVAGPAGAATWGGLTPGESTRRDVEARYGRPSRERQVSEGALVGSEWTYAGDRAPAGLSQMVVGFGLIGPRGFAADVVRGVTLTPKPHVFPVPMLTSGWGKPDAIGTDEQSGRPVLRWENEGLLVLLDRSGQYAELMVFGPKSAGRRP